ncbi:MAG: hypothetical protein K0Q55_2298, partial [Verrucomicrobia bacterium]|jgi:hypothetical protein|nr:hypothetical protein [Verrucomicrobiota bacterium]
METLLSICLGIGLSAACGFRVFIPMLIVSIAANAGHLTLAKGFEWLASDAAVVSFGLATVLEIGAYYIPWLDNLLDSIASPSAVVAGTIITASVMTDMSPFMRWTLAVIAGGGVAAAVQGTTVLARATSTALTGGLANPILATIELGGSGIVSLMAFFVPLLTLAIIVTVLILVGRKLLKRKAEKAMPPPMPV